MKLLNNNNTLIINFINLFKINNNKYIKNFQIILEKTKNIFINIILITHALSGSHHIVGIYKKNLKNIGWWNYILNNIKFINIYNIICISNMGTCYGSTNLKSKNPFNNKNYELNFPKLIITDWIKIQKLIINKIDIKYIFIVIGGSIGGLQALLWSILYPDLIKFCICIASTLKLSLQNISFNEISKLAIINNYYFYKNKYYNYKIKSVKGLKLARTIGYITYLSNNDLKKKLNKFIFNKYYLKNFFFKKISNYLNYQSNKFINYFELTSYLFIINLINNFNFKYNLKKFFFNFFKKNINYLIISFKNDWRFNKNSSIKIINNLIKLNKNISFKIINIKSGHDSFLLKNNNYLNIINNYICKYI